MCRARSLLTKAWAEKMVLVAPRRKRYYTASEVRSLRCSCCFSEYAGGKVCFSRAD